MDIKLLITFIILNIFNVIIQTVKSIATVKCGKSVASVVNAIAYGLYTIVTVYMLCDLDLWLKALIVALCNLVGVFVVQSSKIVGEDGLIAKARKEITNLAEVETIEMTIAGKSTIENNRHLFWIVTGNEYQMHRYYPLEVIEVQWADYYNNIYDVLKKKDISLEDFEEMFSKYSPLLASRYDDLTQPIEDVTAYIETKDNYEYVLLEDIPELYGEAKDELVTTDNDFHVQMPWGYCGNEIFNGVRKAEVEAVQAEKLNAFSV